MLLDARKLDDLYALYGFKKRISLEKNVSVYTFRAGYFNNADIVPIVDGANAERDFEQFKKSGFACAIRTYKSTADAERQLFEGFFALHATRSKFNSEVVRFETRQSDLIGVGYKYISPPYREMFSNREIDSQIPLAKQILNELSNQGPRLIILEAAAGFGKTCTSFELLKIFLDQYQEKIPFFIELSRNRQAKLFHYVLLDEKDRLFPSLSVELVQTQVAEGRLVLIVDGFDELLHRIETVGEDYAEVEPMLETISDLLKKDAKIVVTTRRTAIFSGDSFHQWMEKHAEQFQVSRYSLSQPRLEDWLTYERRQALDVNNFPLRQLSNPVLLAFLSGQSDDDFNELSKKPDVIVDQYYSRLLEREQERQHLPMSPNEQYELFTNLAKHMVEEDFTAEDHVYLQLKIVEDNSRLLQQVRNRYPAEMRPTQDELATKLISHALMDRKSEEGDKVGFINDFVLGTFVGESVIAGNDNEWVAAEGFVEQAITAFIPREHTKRRSLWENMGFVLQFVPIEKRIMADITLVGDVCRDLDGETVSTLNIDGVTMGSRSLVKNTVFVDCNFTNVIFVLNSFKNVTFVSCRFFGCDFDVVGNYSIDNIYLTGCSGDLDVITGLLGGEPGLTTPSPSEMDVYKRRVLEQFWPVGRPHFWPRKQTHTLYRGHANEERYAINLAIEALQSEDIILMHGDMVELNHDKLKTIKEVLGRFE